ncbi:MAG: hypothetical protein FD143_1312 [Ignavibacteria bacterium]|nr:MAG: hypothetical protein FD143_1312 [Ignavibacteria bacterium]KAF0160831.1 MAG: hypothetical protein FD188_1436 [Ignavibacteria bacterium]
MNLDFSNHLVDFACWFLVMFKENHEVINAIILFSTLIAIIIYTRETFLLRKRSEENVNLLKEQLELEIQKNEPNVIAYFDSGNSIRKILLILSNEGGGIANEVKAKIEPQLLFTEANFEKYFYKNALFNQGITIAPSSKYVIYVSFIDGELRKMFDEGKLQTEYTIRIQYKNSSGNSITRTIEQSIAQFFYRIDPEGETPIEKQLKEINTKLSGITSAINGTKKSDE